MKREKRKGVSTSKKRTSRRRKLISFQPKIKKKLLVYICENKFDVVRRVSKSKGYRVTRKFSMISEADLIWNESAAINADILSRMKTHQKLNHFPGNLH